jgi:hypothetical protein
VLLPLGRGGILFGGQAGVLSEYYRGLGYCPPVSYSSGGEIDLIAPLGTGFVFIEPVADGNQVTWLE